MDKSPDAFRTISEVAEMLGTPAHVLRFWESRFPQIRPVKRAGGRRYYRPADVMLLTGIKSLLHDQGLTIRGVQKILREQGVRHVAALSGGDLPEMHAEDSVADLEQALAASFGIEVEDISIEVEPETATIIALETALRQPGRTGPPPRAPEPVAALPDPPDLAESLATLPDQSTDLLAEEVDLFSLVEDSDPPVTDADPESSDPVPLSEVDEILAEISGLATAAAADPWALARRLRHLPVAPPGRDSGRIASLHTRLAALHAAISAVEPAPVIPLP